MSKPDLEIVLNSREYKVIIDHLRFVKAEHSVKAFWQEVEEVARRLDIPFKAKLSQPKERKICFFDTPEHSFRHNGFVLRQRQELKGELHYTLKCRSPDRYVAAYAPIQASAETLGLKNVVAEPKLEEDIAAPFSSRFSHSNTLIFESGENPTFGKSPQTVGDCIQLFPVFETLMANGIQLSHDTPILPVNGLEVYEQVFKMGKLKFPVEKGLEATVSSSMAVILWSLGQKGRPLVAEFSFKYKGQDEGQRFTRYLAQGAQHFFGRVQQMDWIMTDGVTKTRYVYGD